MFNESGIGNTAAGSMAMTFITTGDFNTAPGFGADMGSNNLVNSSAIGANATVSASNSMVLGSISGVTSSAKIGIGPFAPTHSLTVHYRAT